MWTGTGRGGSPGGPTCVGLRRFVDRGRQEGFAGGPTCLIVRDISWTGRATRRGFAVGPTCFGLLRPGSGGSNPGFCCLFWKIKGTVSGVVQWMTPRACRTDKHGTTKLSFDTVGIASGGVVPSSVVNSYVACGKGGAVCKFVT